MSDITASFETLMEQGSMTAAAYMAKAVEKIDDQFGRGFAKKNPGLVGAFIQAAAMDCTLSTLAQQIRLGLDHIAEELPSLSDVADALNRIGNAIEEQGE